MDAIRQMAPWQIILAAVGVLVVFLVGGYFLVTTLTSATPPQAVTSDVPGDLNSSANRKVLKQLDAFEAPNNLPIQTEPLRTPDPNTPSSVNPFE